MPEKSSLSLWPLVQGYLEHLRERRVKEKSIRGMCGALHRFCAFLGALGRQLIAEVTTGDLEAYQTHLLGLRLSTQRNYLVNARQLFRWLEGTGQLFENPAARMVIPRTRRPALKVPTEEQVVRLLETPDTTTAAGLRDRAWLELAYATGARRIEMCRLSLHDLDCQREVVRLFGKGDKERLVPIGKQASYWLGRYLTEARPKLLGETKTPALWLSSRGSRALGYEAIQQRLRAYTGKVGLSRSLLSAHNLRRACATHMLQRGASPLLLQELLGHERAATLSHYLRQTIADVKKTHSRSAPGR